MDKLIITALALQTILILMWVFTLNNRLDALERQTKKNEAYLQSVKYRFNTQGNKILKEIEERGQFIDKSLGTLADKVGGKAHDHRRKKMGRH